MGVSLPQPSLEQRKVIESFSTHNVVCDSVAGSGKTTTILHIAKAFPKRKFLLFTYNQRLKEETRERAVLNGVKNIEVHNYHSFAVKYYSKSSYTDIGLSKMLQDTSLKPMHTIQFDSLILDEAQDMTPLYFKVVCQAVRDNIMASFSCLHICVFGDKYQSIFKYNNADERFIIFADKIFDNGRPWMHVSLQTSYRITKPMCTFLNKAVLNHERMLAVKESEHKVRYIVCNAFGAHPSIKQRAGTYKFGRPFEEIMYYLDDCCYECEDIFVLAPSVKSETSQIRQLANEVSNILEIPIFVPISDEDRIDPQVAQGKMVFSTFHQVKGLERKVVIVMNFDDFMPTMRNLDECSNELYVALTRASERMSIIHHYQNDYLGFLNFNELHKTCYVEMHKKLGIQNQRNGKKRRFQMSELTRHMSLQTLESAFSYISKHEIKSIERIIAVPTKCLQGDLFESTAEINGVAIPAFFAYTHTGVLPILSQTALVQKEQLTPSHLLQLSNEYCAQRSKYVFKLNQIKKYDWLNEDLLNQCNERLLSLIPEPESAKFEVAVQAQIGNTLLLGSIDCIDKDGTIWEFKCTSELGLEDFIQLAIYAYMYNPHQQQPHKPRYKLANILTGQVYEITASFQQLRDLTYFIIHQKINSNDSVSDSTFIEHIESIKKHIFSFECPSQSVSLSSEDSDSSCVFGKCLL